MSSLVRFAAFKGEQLNYRIVVNSLCSSFLWSLLIGLDRVVSEDMLYSSQPNDR